MNVFGQLRQRLSDNRVKELEAKIEAMRSEHEAELVYIGQQHEMSKEVLTAERDLARGELLAVAIELGRVSDRCMGRWQNE